MTDEQLIQQIEAILNDLKAGLLAILDDDPDIATGDGVAADRAAKTAL